jgi:type II secretory ATPase GspE/PulE/Tfp pilus assembly ATPase PilB-like protein
MLSPRGALPAVHDDANVAAEFADLMQSRPPFPPEFASNFVDCLLRLAMAAGASDVHLDPTGSALLVRCRLDGVLNELGQAPWETAPNIIARLKVLAGLLTYETALPQEGRIGRENGEMDVRLSTFPTLHGERAVIRILGTGSQNLHALNQLGLPADVCVLLQQNLAATSGAILIAGPAGSGKTTTAYACLRHIAAASNGGRSVVSLEDPIEVAVDGVAQSQVNLGAGFDMATGLRSLLRTDPEAILIGEMRDRATAEVALQAALTGQLVLTTFHAGNTSEAINRLIDMGIAEYAVRNAVRLVVAQRLLRRLCTCAVPADPQKHAFPLGLKVSRCWIAGSCDSCHATGYRGRSLLAECFVMNDRTFRSAAVISDADDEACSAATGVNRGLWLSAARLVELGTTAPAEVVRVLGLPGTFVH